jgi:hypothetical protein
MPTQQIHANIKVLVETRNKSNSRNTTASRKERGISPPRKTPIWKVPQLECISLRSSREGCGAKSLESGFLPAYLPRAARAGEQFTEGVSATLCTRSQNGQSFNLSQTEFLRERRQIEV